MTFWNRYIDNQLVGEENPLMRRIYLYDMNGEVLGFLAMDLDVGDVVAVYNAQGAKLITYTYDAYLRNLYLK